MPEILASVIPAQADYAVFLGDQKIGFSKRQVPEPGPNQLLLKNLANSLCGSDFPFLFNGNTHIAPGHEIAGIVVKAGKGAKYQEGTRGVVFLMDYCGKCRNCRTGHTNQCLHKRADYGFTNDGGYGPYSVINENVFFPIPDDIPYEEATVLLDIMGTGGHALTRAALVHETPESILILGAGPIGLGLLAMAKLRYGMDFPVMITDVVPYRLKLAEKFLGLPIDLSKQSLAEGLKKHGFKETDISIDSSGKEVARREALDVLSQRGVLVLVGHGEGLHLKISPDMIATERTVMGSEYFCYNELAPNLELYLKNRDFIDQVITHRFPIAELETAFQVFVSRQSGKVIVSHS